MVGKRERLHLRSLIRLMGHEATLYEGALSEEGAAGVGWLSHAGEDSQLLAITPSNAQLVVQVKDVEL